MSGLDIATAGAGMRITYAEALVLREALCTYGNGETLDRHDAWRKLVAWDLMERLDSLAPGLGENARVALEELPHA